ncbi:unnamed protein product [Peniophora sp. CBMAI 1063]|nr:unnamed protein product [Peniophora sp. CBMAI 1063]
MSLSALVEDASSPSHFTEILTPVNSFFVQIRDVVRQNRGDDVYALCEGPIAEAKSDIFSSVAQYQQKHQRVTAQLQLSLRKLEVVEDEINLLVMEREFTEAQADMLDMRLGDLLEQNDPRLAHVRHAIAETTVAYRQVEVHTIESQGIGLAAMRELDTSVRALQREADELGDLQTATTRAITKAVESLSEQLAQLMSGAQSQ